MNLDKLLPEHGAISRGREVLSQAPYARTIKHIAGGGDRIRMFRFVAEGDLDQTDYIF